MSEFVKGLNDKENELQYKGNAFLRLLGEGQTWRMIGTTLLHVVEAMAVSTLIGVCVSVSGSIGFVGLVMPHMTRMVVGPNHKRRGGLYLSWYR